MSKPRILVTRLMTPAVEARIAAEFDAITNPDDHVMTRAEIAAKAEGCAGIFLCGTDDFRADTLAALPDSVNALATLSVGYDHIDLDAARARGIKVGNTPDVLNDATAEITVLCLLGAARVAQDAERVLRQGAWKIWACNDHVGIGLNGKRLGILGMGRIGQGVARRMAGFDMIVHYHNRRRLDPALEFGARYEPDFKAFLGACDMLAITCPLTPETRGLINAEAIAALPDRAVLVNTARGPIVDDNAVLTALASGKLFAVGLDVYTGEPKLDPRYLTAERAFLLPHIGSGTIETRNAMGNLALDNLVAALSGQPMPAPLT